MKQNPPKHIVDLTAKSLIWILLVMIVNGGRIASWSNFCFLEDDMLNLWSFGYGDSGPSGENAGVFLGFWIMVQILK